MLISLTTGAQLPWSLTWHHTVQAERVPHDCPELEQFRRELLSSLGRSVRWCESDKHTIHSLRELAQRR